MHLRAIGVAGRTVKSTADRQCHHGVAILTWLEDAHLVVEEDLEVEVVSVEGVGTQLQHRFHHEFRVFVFWLLCLLFTSVRLIDMYYVWSSFLFYLVCRVASRNPIRKIIDHLLHRHDYNGRDTRPFRYHSDI